MANQLDRYAMHRRPGLLGLRLGLGCRNFQRNGFDVKDFNLVADLHVLELSRILHLQFHRTLRPLQRHCLRLRVNGHHIGNYAHRLLNHHPRLLARLGG
jgi:hypothetical protein